MAAPRSAAGPRVNRNLRTEDGVDFADKEHGLISFALFADSREPGLANAQMRQPEAMKPREIQGRGEPQEATISPEASADFADGRRSILPSSA